MPNINAFPGLLQFARSATVGLIREARNAGMNPLIPATASNPTAMLI
jgi:hypothetical protein